MNNSIVDLFVSVPHLDVNRIGRLRATKTLIIKIIRVYSRRSWEKLSLRFLSVLKIFLNSLSEWKHSCPYEPVFFTTFNPIVWIIYRDKFSPLYTFFPCHLHFSNWNKKKEKKFTYGLKSGPAESELNWFMKRPIKVTKSINSSYSLFIYLCDPSITI